MKVSLICLVCLVVLTGCGGGGGGGGVQNLAPTAVLATSLSPVTRGTWFTSICTYSDANGAADLRDCKFGITPTDNRVCFKYARDTNRLYAFSSTTFTWGPIGGIAPGTNITIDSADAILDCANTTITTVANTITVSYRMQLKPAMTADTYTLSLSCTDVGGLSTGALWVDFGSVTVQ